MIVVLNALNGDLSFVHLNGLDEDDLIIIAIEIILILRLTMICNYWCVCICVAQTTKNTNCINEILNNKNQNYNFIQSNVFRFPNFECKQHTWSKTIADESKVDLYGFSVHDVFVARDSSELCACWPSYSLKWSKQASTLWIGCASENERVGLQCNISK